LPGNPTSISVKYEAPHSAVDEIELEVIAHQSYPTIHIDRIVRASLYAKAQELVELRFGSRYFGAGELLEYAKDRITREVARQELAKSSESLGETEPPATDTASGTSRRSRWYWYLIIVALVSAGIFAVVRHVHVHRWYLITNQPLGVTIVGSVIAALVVAGIIALIRHFAH
jgi:uncharacterized integral membrane protein